VSFGLLSDADCKKALLSDPNTPRSRLKLAVPFVGKDVPSPSSEFAHPDVIIGMTILAYRYSGLRKEDFNDMVDTMTAQFQHEIGPAKERASARMHVQWVQAAGGSIRGVKAKAGAAGAAAAAGGGGTVSTPVRVNPNAQASIALAAAAGGGDAATAAAAAMSRYLPTCLPTRISLNLPTLHDAAMCRTGGGGDKEVVQLKFLQKSNKEQMSKLLSLWRSEPRVIHHYLQKTIFPAHMRSQRKKLSASGQSVGGSMICARRVGFSGTPSDLLPIELGKCDYETGDDGKMLTTLLDPATVTSQFLENDWSVELLLDRIATGGRSSGERFHSLIDTGALVTGYSNQEVAQQLLARGLKWCDGVVFLDDEDRKQVLVRATGRVVSADQCGVPMDRRFAFYDQIHTTGMDIKHVVNACAVITLGKDMVFRDYAQVGRTRDIPVVGHGLPRLRAGR
jgi:hypothetical protein